MQGNERRQERRILQRLGRAGLAGDPVALTFRQRCAEQVVDARVPAQVDRSRKARCPEQKRKRDHGNNAPTARVKPTHRNGGVLRTLTGLRGPPFVIGVGSLICLLRPFRLPRKRSFYEVVTWP